MNEKENKSIQSISRAFDVLRCFIDSEELGLTEIARKINLHKSTTAGIVSTLKQEDMLEINPKSGKYRLGMGLFSLCSSIHRDLRDISRPYLDELLKQGDETVNLAIPDQGMMLYIEKMESLQSVRICTKVGERKPFNCTAVGKAVYAFLDENEVKTSFDRLELRKYTENTLIKYSALKKELEKVRKNGYAIDDEEFEYGLVCIAAPIFDKNGCPIASLSISGPTVRMNEGKLQSCINMVCSAAYKVTKEILVNS